mgnify:CR=1 FL=1
MGPKKCRPSLHTLDYFSRKKEGLVLVLIKIKDISELTGAPAKPPPLCVNINGVCIKMGWSGSSAFFVSSVVRFFSDASSDSIRVVISRKVYQTKYEKGDSIFFCILPGWSTALQSRWFRFATIVREQHPASLDRNKCINRRHNNRVDPKNSKFRRKFNFFWRKLKYFKRMKVFQKKIEIFQENVTFLRNQLARSSTSSVSRLSAAYSIASLKRSSFLHNSTDCCQL